MSSPNLGLGVSPLGVGPYGFGTPAGASSLNPKLYRDGQNNQQNSRAISLKQDTLGQYTYDVDGNAQGMPSVQQMVILAARTVRGSSVDTTLGNTFAQERYVGDNFLQRQTARVNECFKSLIDQAFVRIDSVEIDGGGGLPAVTLVRMTDLTTGNPLEPVTL